MHHYLEYKGRNIRIYSRDNIWEQGVGVVMGKPGDFKTMLSNEKKLVDYG